MRLGIEMAAVLVTALAVVSTAVQPAAAGPAPAKVEAKRTVMVEGDLKVTVIDLSPRFLDFYAAARSEPDPDRRFALWKSKYGFAAVPPGPQGEAISRELLDEAWPRYAAALPTLEAGARAMRPDPLSVLRSVSAILDLKGPAEVRVTAFVGGFEGNAFAARDEDGPIVAMPLEMSAEDRAVVFAHEMAHAAHMLVADLSGGWERSIGATALQEGLAMHVAREVAPGRPVEAYVEHRAGWFAEVQGRRQEILEGILPHLAATDGERVFQFTMGDGSAGFQREAYLAGWLVVERLRAKGMSLAQIARIPEEDMPQVVADTIREILAS